MRKETIKRKLRQKLLFYVKKYDVYTTGRKNKFNPEFYIKYITIVLFSGICWSELDEFDMGVTSDTIRKKFYRWIELGIFQLAYTDMIKKYGKSRNFPRLDIDSTNIVNANGTENLGYCYKSKGKKSTGLTIISDKNKVVVGYHVHKSSENDSKLITPTLRCLPTLLGMK